MSNIISDNFIRANGALGSNWATPVPNNAEFPGWGGTPAGNVLISNNGVGPDATNGLDCACIWAGAGAGSFGNDQWASAQVKTVALQTAVLAISAASKSGSNVTYTYTVTSGDASAQIGAGFLYVVITGMAHAGNNGAFNATTFGAGTFTVVNAAGTTATESGVGTCPSDSGAGVGIRMSGTSAATLNGYFMHCGTNSSSGDGRTYYHELWKVVNGAGTILGNFAVNAPYVGNAADTFAMVAGDVIAISAVGTTITGWYNGVKCFQVTDSAVASGTPGLWTFAVNGASEYHFSLWTSGSTQFTGNNGTTLNNFQASDTGSPAATMTADTFTYSNGDLHTANAHWVYQGTSKFQIATNKVYKGPAVSQALSQAYRDDITVGAAQSAQVTAVITTISATQNGGPAVYVGSSSQDCYTARFANNLMALSRINAGVLTDIVTSQSNAPANGTIIAINVIRGFIFSTVSGHYKQGGFDASLSSGSAGIMGAGDATSNGQSAWAGGNSGTTSTWNITGNTVVAGVTVSYTGTASGSVVSDGSGNYSIGPLIPGSYTITPTKAGGYTFSPASSPQTLTAADITGVNFSSSGGGGSFMQAFRNFINKKGEGF